MVPPVEFYKTNMNRRGFLTLAVSFLATLFSLSLGISPITRADSPQEQGQVYRVQKGDTLYEIGRRYGVSASSIARANGLLNPDLIYVEQVLSIPPNGMSSGLTHVVQRGESLSKIATRYGVSLAGIVGVNPEITNPNSIYMGQVLNIPNTSVNVPQIREEENIRPPQEETSISIDEFHWIEVDLSEQKLIYHGGDETRKFLVSTGVTWYPTIPGTYKILAMWPYCSMSGPGYDFEKVYRCMLYDKRRSGYLLHGAYWHNNFGHPMSHGCVNLSNEDADWVYKRVKVGTKVVIHE